MHIDFSNISDFAFKNQNYGLNDGIIQDQKVLHFKSGSTWEEWRKVDTGHDEHNLLKSIQKYTMNNLNNSLGQRKTVGDKLLNI